MSNNSNTIVVAQTKNMGLALLLTILFGPLGMLYATIPGAIVMILLSAIIGFLTAGFGALALWPINMVWTVIAVYRHNKRLMRGTQS